MAWAIALASVVCAIVNSVKDSFGNPVVPEGAAWVIAVVFACQAWSLHWQATEMDAIKSDYKKLVSLVCGDLMSGLSDHMKERDKTALMRLLGTDDAGRTKGTRRPPGRRNAG